MKKKDEKELLERIEKAYKNESKWYQEGQRLRILYKKLYKKEA